MFSLPLSTSLVGPRNTDFGVRESSALTIQRMYQQCSIQIAESKLKVKLRIPYRLLGLYRKAQHEWLEFLALRC
jgi:hypothetical protein